MTFRIWRWQFQPKLLPSVVCLALLVLLLSLGRWQVHRYHFKQDLLRQYAEAAHGPGITFNDFLKKSDKRFVKVNVQGHYLPDNMLLINKLRDGQVGVEVLTPFKVANHDKLLLVNRGWIIKAPPSLTRLRSASPTAVPSYAGQARPHSSMPPPALSPPPSSLSAKADNPVHKPSYVKSTKVLSGSSAGAPDEDRVITGTIKLPEYVFILGDNILQPNIKPLQMQKIDFKELEKITHKSFYPYSLRLSKEQANGFRRDWPVTTVKPAKHLGYAVQWFSMAFVLVLAYLALSRKK